MPDQLQLRGGTTAEHSTFTGASKEVTVDTTKKTAVVHDGTTAGGLPLMREDASNAALALGSVGTPSLKFTGDTNTGIYSPGADTLAFVTAGANRLHITSGGLLGLGTSTPWSKLTVGGGGTANPAADVTIHDSTIDQYRLKLTSTNFNANTKWLGIGLGYSDNYLKAGIIAEAVDSNARSKLHFCLNDLANSANASLSDSRMVITSGGSVGIGSTGPDARLLVSDGTNINTRIGQLTLDNFTGEGAGIRFSRTTSDDTLCGLGAVNAGDGDLGFFSRNNLIFATGGASNYSATTERARIDSSGNIAIGTSSTSGARLFVTGGALTSSVAGGLAIAGSLSTGRLTSDSSNINSIHTYLDNSTIEIAPGSTYKNGISINGNSTSTDTSTIKFFTGNSERARIDTSGRLLVGVAANANGGILQLTSGITFPATAVAASDVNTLDDYEEGTWTPGISFGGGTTGITYNSSFTGGTYTKVGRMVTVYATITLTNKGSSTGSAKITGLPFTAATSYSQLGIAATAFNLITSTGQVWTGVDYGATTIAISQTTTAGVRSLLADTNFANSSDLQITMSYFV